MVKGITLGLHPGVTQAPTGSRTHFDSAVAFKRSVKVPESSHRHQHTFRYLNPQSSCTGPGSAMTSSRRRACSSQPAQRADACRGGSENCGAGGFIVESEESRMQRTPSVWDPSGHAQAQLLTKALRNVPLVRQGGGRRARPPGGGADSQ